MIAAARSQWFASARVAIRQRLSNIPTAWLRFALALTLLAIVGVLLPMGRPHYYSSTSRSGSTRSDLHDVHSLRKAAEKNGHGRAGSPAIGSRIAAATSSVVAGGGSSGGGGGGGGGGVGDVPRRRNPPMMRRLAQQVDGLAQLSITMREMQELGAKTKARVTQLVKEQASWRSARASHWRQQDAIVHNLSQSVAGYKKQLLREKLVDEDTPCAINPSVHFGDTGKQVRECPVTWPRGSPDVHLPDHSYMLSLRGPRRLDEVDAVTAKRTFLAQHGIHLSRFQAVNGSNAYGHLYRREWSDKARSARTVYRAPGQKHALREGDPGYLTPGERGYIASMRGVFTQALRHKSVTSILVLDDDAIFTCSFEKDLRRVLAQPRCGLHVSPSAPKGGVLLLGAAIWINGSYPVRGRWTGGWNQVWHDLKVAQKAAGGGADADKPLCFNADEKTYGSFGVVYHRDTFKDIIKWTEKAREPFDHIWPALSRQGYPVRVALPNLIIQDVRHASQVDNQRDGQSNLLYRARVHRWNLKSFCTPDGHHLEL